jgi:dTDP-4-amino-4,6-dideoxy-D-glucose acyltransferase
MYNFKSIGQNVKISPKASIYRAENIEIGNNVRIDDFCILSAGEGGIKIGNNVHIACYTHFIGAGRIECEDHSQFSSHCGIFSSTDDFSGKYLVGPCVPMEDRNVYSAPVTFKRFCVLGASVVIMPGVTIGEGSAIGVNSFVKSSVPDWSLYVGSPAKFIREMQKPFIYYSEYGHRSA